ncbi:MAG: phosphatase PAP2 family protein [Sandaracinaceae bacterium]
MSRATLALAAAIAVCALASPVAAQTRLRWSDDWQRVHPASYVATTTSVAAAIFVDQLYEPPEGTLWRGPILFDRDVRASLMAAEDPDREVAATLSDVLLGALLVWPALDAWGVVGLGDWNSDVFWQLTNIALEVVAADFALGTLIKLFTDRERPHGDRCSEGSPHGRFDRCGRRGISRSFYSGHASAAFASAGNVCMSHAYLPIYGGAAQDALACGGAVLLASIVGVLRVIADRHYGTDVLIGAAVGLATGLALPYLLHYGWHPGPEIVSGTAPLSATTPVMLSWGGRF